MKIEPKIRNEKRLAQLDFLYEELKKQNDFYKTLKQSSNEYNEELNFNQLRLTKQKILSIIFKIRKLLQDFEITENPY